MYITEKVGISFGVGMFILVTQLSYGMFHLFKSSNEEYEKRILNVLYSHIAMVWQFDSLLNGFMIMTKEVVNIRFYIYFISDVLDFKLDKFAGTILSWLPSTTSGQSRSTT